MPNPQSANGPPESDRKAGRTLVAVAVGVALWPVLAGLPAVQEDGFYYLKIAQHVAHGAGSTFDGSHPTNGYHPLWLLCLLPIVAVISSPSGILVAVIALQTALVGATVRVLYAALRRLAEPWSATTAVVLWMLLSRRQWLEGLEYALQGFLTAALLFVFLGRFFGSGRLLWPAELKPFLKLGGVLALCVLARLDAALAAPVLGLSLLVVAWRAGILSRRPGWTATRLAALALPPASALGLYLAVNLALFGHGTPVSGAVKRDWSAELMAAQPFYQAHGFLVEKLWSALRPLLLGWGGGNLRPLALSMTVLGLWLVGAVVIGLWRLRHRRPPRSGADGLWERATPLVPFAVYGAASYGLYIVTFHRSMALAPRYFVVQPMVAAAVLGER